MKILPVHKIREADEFTIIHEPISDIDLMERAATACFSWLITNVPPNKKIRIFCGTGNNGGDGMVIARLMATRGYSVEVNISGPEGKFTSNCRTNYNRLLMIPGVSVTFLSENKSLPKLSNDSDIIIDALIGSGLTKPVTGFISKVIEHINNSPSLKISIDIPSGLLSDETMSEHPKTSVVHADYTLTFAPLKLGFLFPENDVYVGNWQLFDIGISQEFIDQTETKNYYLQPEDIRPLLKSRNTYSHKGHFGHALLICGSTGKMGAAVLSARSCLRAGAGLVSVHIPKDANAILQTAVPEAMVNLDESDSIFSGIGDLSLYNAIAVGPGIGEAKDTMRAMKNLIQNAGIPVIFDADAINILGENKTWISFVPKGSIFTPHPKEFERLAGKTSNQYERNKLQRDFSIKYGVYVILKGAHTAITSPDGKCYFNSTGNPGMATAGSGDVLTGILAGLKAQGYSSLETCLLGTYLHGLAGDFSAEVKGQEAMIAGDIIENLGKAFLSLHNL
jgi:ADP-dependent NAD(P)H-hydrate dehydratase / NAD(P)H-hydrate epimerase